MIWKIALAYLLIDLLLLAAWCGAIEWHRHKERK